MPLSANFNGQTVTRPGAYSQIKSAIQNPVTGISNNTVLLLDTGTLGADGFGAGAGVIGQRVSGARAVTTFTGLDQMRAAVRGGLTWLLARPLFNPAGLGSKGAPKVLYLRAAETTAAKLALTFASGGSLPLVALNEGTVANGALTATELTSGLATRLRVAPGSTTKFILELWGATFRGLDADGDPYDFTPITAAPAERLASSPAVSDVADLISWLKRDKVAQQFVAVGAGAAAGAIAAADVTSQAGYQLFADGTITYTPAAYAAALLAIANLDYTFVLSDKYGADAQGTVNTQLLSHLLTKAKYQKFLIVGGGYDEDAFTSLDGTLDTTAYFNSERVTVVHAGLELKTPQGLKAYSQYYKAAAYAGLRASKAPQVPCTFKSIEMDGDVHELNADQVTAALAGGALCTVYDDQLGYCVLQDINTLQGARNENFVNEDGTSYENSISLIMAAVNKQLVIKAKVELFSDPDGVNRNTLELIDMQQWVEGQLDKMTATKTTDNLILSADTIVVTLDKDGYYTSYRAEPNFPLNKMFFTGFLIDRSAQ
jgi:hypothetical protein